MSWISFWSLVPKSAGTPIVLVLLGLSLVYTIVGAIVGFLKFALNKTQKFTLIAAVRSCDDRDQRADLIKLAEVLQKTADDSRPRLPWGHDTGRDRSG